ncbi:MAG: hypothetical protein AAB821_02775 [Patescibacteria group bacterium]
MERFSKNEILEETSVERAHTTVEQLKQKSEIRGKVWSKTLKQRLSTAVRASLVSAFSLVAVGCGVEESIASDKPVEAETVENKKTEALTLKILGMIGGDRLNWQADGGLHIDMGGKTGFVRISPEQYQNLIKFVDSEADIYVEIGKTEKDGLKTSVKNWLTFEAEKVPTDELSVDEQQINGVQEHLRENLGGDTTKPADQQNERQTAPDIQEFL